MNRREALLFGRRVLGMFLILVALDISGWQGLSFLLGLQLLAWSIADERADHRERES